MTLDEARDGIGRDVAWVGPKDCEDDEDAFGVIARVKEPFVYVVFEPNKYFAHPALPEWVDFPVVVRG